MKLCSVFTEDRVLVQHEGSELKAIVSDLVATLGEVIPEEEQEALVEKLVARELENPSVVKKRACILSRRIPELKSMVNAVAVLEEPIAHPSLEEAQIRLVFVVLCPQLKNTMLLQTVAAIERLVSSKKFVTAAKSLKAGSRFIRLAEESGIEIKTNLTAGDVMEPITERVSMDTPLVEAVGILSRVESEGIPVVDDEDKLLGEFTTKDLLILGMPKYMDLLSNPEMLNEFEPFENYFENEYNTEVRDVCRKDFCAVSPSEPIITVAHQMITENRRRIYVVSEDKVRGIIQRKDIVQSVLNS